MSYEPEVFVTIDGAIGAGKTTIVDAMNGQSARAMNCRDNAPGSTTIYQTAVTFCSGIEPLAELAAQFPRTMSKVYDLSRWNTQAQVYTQMMFVQALSFMTVKQHVDYCVTVHERHPHSCLAFASAMKKTLNPDLDVEAFAEHYELVGGRLPKPSVRVWLEVEQTEAMKRIIARQSGDFQAREVDFLCTNTDYWKQVKRELRTQFEDARNCDMLIYIENEETHGPNELKIQTKCIVDSIKRLVMRQITCNSLGEFKHRRYRVRITEDKDMGKPCKKVEIELMPVPEKGVSNFKTGTGSVIVMFHVYLDQCVVREPETGHGLELAEDEKEVEIDN